MRLLPALIAALMLAPTAALAQSTLLQGGPTTQGHAPAYANQGNTGSQAVVLDSGPAGGGGPGLGLSELNLTARGTGTAPFVGQGTGPNGEIFCIQDAPTTNAAGYHSLCFSANVANGALLSYGAGGTASTQPLNFKINGTNYSFPFTTNGAVGPGSTTVGHLAVWNNTTGTLLADTLTLPAATVVTGSLGLTGTAPTLSSCGTSPSILGDDFAGTVTMGTGTPTGCVITFAASKVAAPHCNVTWRATPLASQSYAISTTAITLTQTATSSNVVDYMCAGL